MEMVLDKLYEQFLRSVAMKQISSLAVAPVAPAIGLIGWPELGPWPEMEDTQRLMSLVVLNLVFG